MDEYHIAVYDRIHFDHFVSGPENHTLTLRSNKRWTTIRQQLQSTPQMPIYFSFIDKQIDGLIYATAVATLESVLIDPNLSNPDPITQRALSTLPASTKEEGNWGTTMYTISNRQPLTDPIPISKLRKTDGTPVSEKYKYGNLLVQVPGHDQRLELHSGELIDPAELTDIQGRSYFEGTKIRLTTNVYERSRAARAQCIAHCGTQCVVCGLDFEQTYGPLAKGYIHIHHTNPISDASSRRAVDPTRDLVPVCPNCHAVIHLQNPPLTIEEVKQLLAQHS